MADKPPASQHDTDWVCSSGEVVRREPFHLYAPKGFTSTKHMDHPYLLRFLMPGDIVLFVSDEGVIRNFCKDFGYCENSSAVTHCAIYLARDAVCHSVLPSIRDITLGGVRVESLMKYIGFHTFPPHNPEILRAIYVVRANQLSEIERLHIALRASSYATAEFGYNYHQILHCLDQWLSKKSESTDDGKFIKSACTVLDYISNNFGTKQLSILFGSMHYSSHCHSIDQSEDSDSAKHVLKCHEECLVLSRFICSDFVNMVYDEILKQRNPLNRHGGTRCPIFLPADIFENENLSTVSTIFSLDPNLVKLSDSVEDLEFFEVVEEQPGEVVSLRGSS